MATIGDPSGPDRRSPVAAMTAEETVSQRRFETWLAPLGAMAGLAVLALLGVWAYLTTPAPPLHPDLADVPSVTRSAPLPRWTDEVAEARRIVRSALVARNLPGLSVAVGVAGDLAWAEGFGWADLESRVPATPETQFRIGTASTALTSAAVGLLLEQARLALDDEIQTHVPAFPKKPWPVTVRALMGHTAGVRTDGGDEGPLLAEHCQRPADALPYFAEQSLLFEPGTQFRHSSYGWILVSAAVEAAAHTPFDRFMRKQVFEPLGMDDTRADMAAGPRPDQATSYFPRFSADPRYGADLMRPIDLSCYAGAGAFLSTPSDLVRFGMAMRAGRLLRPATVAQLPSWQGRDGDVLGGQVASLMIGHDDIVVAVTSNESYAETSTVAAAVARAFAPQ